MHKDEKVVIPGSWKARYNFYPNSLKPMNSDTCPVPKIDTSNCSSLYDVVAEQENIQTTPRIPDLEFTGTKNYSWFSARNNTDYYRWAKQKTAEANRIFPSKSGPSSWLNPISTKNSANNSLADVKYGKSKSTFKHKRHSDGHEIINKFLHKKGGNKSTVRVQNNTVKDLWSEYYLEDPFNWKNSSSGYRNITKDPSLKSSSSQTTLKNYTIDNNHHNLKLRNWDMYTAENYGDLLKKETHQRKEYNRK